MVPTYRLLHRNILKIDISWLFVYYIKYYIQAGNYFNDGSTHILAGYGSIVFEQTICLDRKRTEVALNQSGNDF